MEKLKKVLLMSSLCGLVAMPVGVLAAEMPANKLDSLAIKVSDTYTETVDLTKCTADAENARYICEAEVKYATEGFDLVATSTNSDVLDASTLEGIDFSSNSGLYQIKLADKDADPATIKVTYELDVKRESVTPALKTFTFKNGDVELTPTIEGKKYTVKLDYAVEKINVAFTADDIFDVSGFAGGEVTLTPGGSMNSSIKVAEKRNPNNYVVYELHFERAEHPLQVATEAAVNEKYGENADVYVDFEEGVVYFSLYTEDNGTTVEKYYTIEFTEEDTADTIMAAIEEAQKKPCEDMSIYTNEEGTISDAIIKSVKDGKTTASIYSYSAYMTWLLDGTKITDTDKGFNANVRVGDEVDEKTTKKIEALYGKGDKGLIIDFEHSGALPKGTSVVLYVSDYDFADQVYNLYYYNEKTGKLELVVNNVKKEVEDGYVTRITVPIEHCSTYTLLPAKNNAKTGVLNVVLYVSIAMVSVAGLVFVFKKKMN